MQEMPAVDQKMKAIRTYKGRTVHEYSVSGIPPDADNMDIINFCDDGNFGGKVCFSADPTRAHVYVYVD